MTVLVTGGAGYIGAHTVRALRDASRDVVVLDTLERGNRNAVIDAKLIVGDIADQKLVAKICRKYKITDVVHFAAYKAVGESMTHPMKYWQNNVASTIKLLETLISQNVYRFVFLLRHPYMARQNLHRQPRMNRRNQRVFTLKPN